MALSKIDVANMVENVAPESSIPDVSFRNIIINGDMSIAQRGTSTASVTSQGYHACDRFNFNPQVGTYTISQSTTVPSGQGFAKSLKVDVTTASASPGASTYVILSQRIEGQMLQYLKKGTSSAESLTLSFWVRSNKTGTYIVEFYDSDNTRQISKSYTISSADTWEKKTITIDGDTTGAFDNDNAGSLNVQFILQAGTTYTSGTLNTSWNSVTNANRFVGQVNLADSTSNELYLTGVQLEVGTAASDFEFLPTDVNLQRCQRYFYKIESTGTTSNNNITTGFTYGTSGVQSNVKMKVLMRSTPSFSYDIGTNGLILYNNSDSITASVPKIYAFAPFGGLLYFDSDLSGTFGATYRPVNVSFNTSPTQTKVLKFDAEL